MSHFGLPNFNMNNLLSQAQQVFKQDNGTNVQNTPTQNMQEAISEGGFSIYQVGSNGRYSLAALLGNQSLRLNTMELSQFLKDAMKLPQEVRLILLMLAFESSQSPLKENFQQTLKNLIEADLNQLKVPLEEVQTLLTKNTKEASDTLMKLIQANQMSITDGGRQVADLVSHLGKLTDKINTSPAHAMETLMLLYLPWYPLTPPQRLEVDFEFGEGGEEGGGEKEFSVVLYLNTNTFGRFKLIVSELDPLQVMVKVFHEAHAKGMLSALEASLNQILANEGLPAAIFVASEIKPEQIAQTVPLESDNSPETQNKPEEAEAAGFKKATRQADRKSLKIQPGQQVSLLILHCAYALARLIFEADEENRPLQSKKTLPRQTHQKSS